MVVKEGKADARDAAGLARTAGLRQERRQARRFDPALQGPGRNERRATWGDHHEPEKRTLLQVRLEDLVESEEIFSTLMGEDVESRRKFIEENALDVKNLDV